MLKDTEALWAPGCHLVFGFAPGASATKQPLAFCDSPWDLFCSGAWTPTAPLAGSGAALEPWLIRGGQLGLQGQSRSGSLRGILCCPGTGMLPKSWQGHWLPAS